MVRQRLVILFSNFKEAVDIREARDVRDAIEIFDLIGPDLAVVDIQMPGGSGIEVLRHIKRTSRETTVIMYTSYPYPQYRETCFKEGTDYFFDKTTESEKLIDTILRVIGSEGSKTGCL